MSFLCYNDDRATWLQVPSINIGAPVNVVGEERYQQGLETVAGGRNAFGVRRRNVTAVLIREPSNSYDVNAVRVEVGGAKVGYIGRDDAPRFHKILDRLVGENVEATCRGVLVGGWDRGGDDRGSIGIKVLTGRRPLRWNGKAAFIPSGPWREYHYVTVEAPEISWLADRAVLGLTEDGVRSIVIEQDGTPIGRIVNRPDLARFIGRVRAVGLPATVQAYVSPRQVNFSLCDPDAIAASLDKLGTGDLRSIRARLRPTGRWMCERCHMTWNDTRQAPQRWYDLTDEFDSPHICPSCGSYAFTHPY